ncbi:uncharacterized protein LOC130950290 [Arachis stenosperma]|uniref:uncharacterized protein LOC130950290 n=1 Tax=Arachis stenosperma TaxID=217475 RepID=UPI0025AB9830|nr:uncharacterized protein LOC130950290 [Arachis stenosperma]
MVKRVCIRNRVDFVGLSERKKGGFDRGLIRNLWGDNSIDWAGVESSSSVGGIICMWRNNFLVCSDIFRSDRWIVVKGCIKELRFDCAICVVYGPHLRDEKKAFWDGLMEVKKTVGVPIMYGGDFNKILKEEERKGNRTLSQSSREFKQWVSHMELMDMNLSGRRFTWYGGKCCSRIDRVFVDCEWQEVTKDLCLKGLNRALSDHCPLLLASEDLNWGSKPFRTMDAWLLHGNFVNKVGEEWRKLVGGQILEKFKAIKMPLRVWNKERFGYIDYNIQKVEDEIKAIDEKMESSEADECVLARMKALRVLAER